MWTSKELEYAESYIQRTAGKTKDLGGYFGPKMASEATLDHLIQKKFQHTPDPPNTSFSHAHASHSAGKP